MAARGFSGTVGDFASIGASLNDMMERKKVDPLIVNRLDKLIRFFGEKENYWRDNKTVPIKSAFTVYHGWRNMRLIADKMKHRFLDAEKVHENPKVAIDSLKVLPSLLDAYTGVAEAEGRELSRDEETAILNRITELRNVAYHSDMLPSMNEELREVDSSTVVQEFDKFATGAQLSEETPEGHTGD